MCTERASYLRLAGRVRGRRERRIDRINDEIIFAGFALPHTLDSPSSALVVLKNPPTRVSIPCIRNTRLSSSETRRSTSSSSSPLSHSAFLLKHHSSHSMAVHYSRRRGPLPSDIEFACLDSTSSGHSLVELASQDNNKGKQRANTVDSSRPGDVEIVPLIKMGHLAGLDGVKPTSPLLLSLFRMTATDQRFAVSQGDIDTYSVRTFQPTTKNYSSPLVGSPFEEETEMSNRRSNVVINS